MDRGYILITPLKDEAGHLDDVIRHVVCQRHRPSRWVLVDDHSDDGSNKICRSAAKKYRWIRAVTFDGEKVGRRLGSHVYEVQRFGYEFATALCGRESVPYRYVGFLDADMLPAVDYYERLTRIMNRSPEFGIVSGGVYLKDAHDRIQWDESPLEWPWGGARLIRRECCERVGGVMPTNAADTVSAIKAMDLGYRVRQFKDIEVVQLRETSSATGLRAGYYQKGINDYVLGYSLFFAVGKGIRRSLLKSLPLSLCYLAGFVSSLLKGRDRIDDLVVREFCGNRVRRLFFQKELSDRVMNKGTGVSLPGRSL